MREEVCKTRKFNSKSKASKRRARNKRRKKEKQQRRYQERAEDEPTPTASTSSAPEPDQSYHSQHQEHGTPIDAASRMWQRTYENSVRWLCSQQIQFLRQQVDILQQENDFLRAQLYNRDAGEQEEEYITSPSGSEDEEGFEYDEPAEVDEGYLKFIEITLRHREELRKTREQEAIQKQQADDSGL